MKSQKTLEEKIGEIINKHDPIGLIEAGCPPDEYNPEAKRIFAELKKARWSDDFHNAVYGIFVEMFDENIAGSIERYKELSKELYSLKQQ